MATRLPYIGDSCTVPCSSSGHVESIEDGRVDCGKSLVSKPGDGRFTADVNPYRCGGVFESDEERHFHRDLIFEAQILLSFDLVPIVIRPGTKAPVHEMWNTTPKSKALSIIQETIRGVRRPDINLGILTGRPSNIIVVDVDVKNRGMEVWNSFTSSGPEGGTSDRRPDDIVTGYPPLDTLVVRTGSGGLHIYFRGYPISDRTHVERREIPSRIRAIENAGIDIRSTGSQVLAPGSIHPITKRVYTIIQGSLGNISRMPEWLYNLLA